MARYERPASLGDAVALLAAPGWTILAGGTDIYPARVGRPLDADILDLTGVADLRTIERVGDRYRIPALATWMDLRRAALPASFDGLRAAAGAIGGVQIQHRATIVGNLCNASPAADGLPNLLALDATVEVASTTGRREVPVGAFVTGNRRTALGTDELVSAILVPATAAGRTPRAAFHKLGSRAYLVISIVSVAVVVERDADGGIAVARVAVGACSEVPVRLAPVEDRLVGQAADPGLAATIVADDLAALAPLDDVRGSATYRRDAGLTLIRRAVAEVLA